MLLLLTSLSAAATLPAGSEIERAFAIHIPQAGFRHLGDAVEGLVPEAIPVSDLSGVFECDSGSGVELSYTLASTDLLLTAQNVDIYSADGALNITLYMTLASTPAELAVQGDCSFLTELDEVCDVEIPTTLVILDMALGLELVDGPDGVPVVEASVSDPTFTVSPIGNMLDGCVLANAVGTLLNTDEELLSKLVVGLVEPSLAGIGADLETTVEDALGALVIDSTFALGEADIALQLYPTLLELQDDGLVLGLGGTVTPSVVSDCVVDPGGSEFADAPWPDFNDTAWDSTLGYDAGIFLSKGFVDQLLYAVHVSGGLCLEISDLGGTSLNTDLFGPVFGDSFQALFPEAVDMTLATRPAIPPSIRFMGDGAPMRMDLAGFGLDIYSTLDGRDLRVTRVDVEAEIGIDPGLYSTELAPELIIDPDDMRFVEKVNEFLEPGYSEGLYDFMPTVLGSFLPEELLPVIAIPQLYGIGLDTVVWEPGMEDEWLGGFVLMDLDTVQPIDAPGCQGGSLGCDGGEGLDLETALGCGELGCGSGGSGCDSGSGCEDASCATSPNGTLSTTRRFIVPNRLVLLGLLGFATLLRRRED